MTQRPTSLSRTAARGGLVSAFGTWGRFVLQFGTVVVVARLLGPEEYGFAAVVLVFSSISELLRGSGLASAILQRADLDRAIASRVHYISCTAGIACGALLLLGAAPLGAMFGDDRLVLFAPLLAIVIACGGASAVPAALMARAHRFGRLAMIDVGAAMIGCATALVLALAGAGAASLVWQAVAVAVVTCGAVTACSSFRPGLPASRESTRPYARFGANAAVTQVVRYAAQNSDRVLLATTSGASSVGWYAQAVQLIQLPVAQLSAPLQRVIIPVLSRLVDEPDRYRSYFRSALQLFMLLLWPVLTVLAVFAPELVTVVFGVAWVESGNLMRLLMGTGFSAPLVFAASWVFVSTGSARAQAVLMVGISSLTILAILFGLQFGPAGVALCASGAAVLGAVPAVVLAARCAPIRIADVLAPMVWPAVVSGAMGATSALGTLWISEPALKLVVGGIIGAVSAGVVFAASSDLRGTLRNILHLLKRDGDRATALTKEVAS